MHNTEGEWVKHDITTITNEEWAELRGTVDIIAGGFPCQAFSIAGKRGGFEDTRGTLFFDIARAAKEIQPSYLFLENVKGLFSHDKGRTFGTIIQALDELGYFVEWGLFNSKFWGVPQNRERVFIVATRKDVYEKPILFDLLKQQELNGVNVKLRDVLETEVEEKFYLSKEQTDRLVFNMSERDKAEDEIKILAHRKSYRRNTQVFDKDGLTETLDTGQGGGRGHYTMEEPIKVIGSTQKNAAMTDGSHSPTLTSSMGSGGGHVPMMVFEEPKVVEQQTHSYNRKDGVGNEIEVGHTLMARDYKGFGNQDMSAVVEIGLPIKEATKQGYALATDGDSVNLQYPDSKTRRGRVGNQIANTLQAGETNQGVVINPLKGKTDNGWHFEQAVYDDEGITRTLKAGGGSGNIPKTIEYAIGASRGRNPENPSDRTTGAPTEQRLEINQDGTSNTLTSVQKDNYVVESKQEIGRFGRQAAQTFNENYCDFGDTINAYNMTVDKSGQSPTLTTRPEGFKTAILPITANFRIRKLTPLECFRLQGFPDNLFYKAQEVNSNSQLYKQAGNSVTVNVIEAIAKELRII